MLELRGRERFTFHDIALQRDSFREAVLSGLSQPNKSIPCQFLYDERGSQLFDEICTLPEYYPTRTELKILRKRAKDIARFAGPGAQLIELGAGSSFKARILLDAFVAPAAYAPIDVSREHLRAAGASVARDYARVQVAALCADYSAPLTLPNLGAGKRVGFFPGSTIGNLTPEHALGLLQRWRDILGSDALMIVGVDLKKDRETLEAAYDDALGVTEDFIKNILVRANRELDADFDPDAFIYEARYRDDPGRVEMALISAARQSVRLAGHRFRFAAGERLHVENSHKYAIGDFSTLATQAGYTPSAVWTDPKRLFSVHLLETGAVSN
jgi:dimethylhistidine N-methyltransferase